MLVQKELRLADTKGTCAPNLPLVALALERGGSSIEIVPEIRLLWDEMRKKYSKLERL